MKKLGIVVIAGVVLLVAVGAAAFFFLGTIVKTGVEKVGPNITKTTVKLDGAVISVFNGSGQLKGFVIGNPEGFKTPTAVKVGSVALSLRPRSVLSQKVVIHSVRVEAPEITYEAALGGSNIGKLLDNMKSTASQDKSAGSTSPASSGTKKALQVDEFVITGGKINVSASVLGGRSATLPLPEIRLTSLGQGPEGITPAELATKVFSQVVDAAAKVVAEDAVKFGKDVTQNVKDIGTDAKDRLKKASSGVTDLLKNKVK